MIKVFLWHEFLNKVMKSLAERDVCTHAQTHNPLKSKPLFVLHKNFFASMYRTMSYKCFSFSQGRRIRQEFRSRCKVFLTGMLGCAMRNLVNNTLEAWQQSFSLVLLLFRISPRLKSFIRNTLIPCLLTLFLLIYTAIFTIQLANLVDWDIR